MAQLLSEIKLLQTKTANAKDLMETTDLTVDVPTPRTRGGKSKSAASETLSVASEAPAPKRSNSAATSQGQITEMEKCP